MNKLVSIIIPTFDEQKVISGCLNSLLHQTQKDLEIIVVDDGSTDETVGFVKELANSNEKIILLEQKHLGPGSARNLGAQKAKGDILVFVDADMEFEPDFISKLTAPISSGGTIGTFSKEEHLLNSENAWARCWNLNLGREATEMKPGDFTNKKNVLYEIGKTIFEKIEGSPARVSDSKDQQHVFRAILKNKFNEAGGFDEKIGYTDDWSLARKLNVLASSAPGARFYHRNPENLTEIWVQARWFGKNEFLTRNAVRRLYNLVRYNPVIAIVLGLFGAIKYGEPNFFVFKIVYDTAVLTSVLMSFFKETKAK